MVILEERYVRVSYDSRTNTIETIWKDFATSDEYRRTINLVCKTILKNRPRHWVMDYRHAGVVAVKDQEWFYNSILPKIARAGLKTAPAIASEDIFSRIYSDESHKRMKKVGIAAEYFSDRQAIDEWLLTGHLGNEHPRAAKFKD